MHPLRIAVIGLDTSHVEAFATLLHDETHPHHVPGGRIVTAFPGGSEDFPLSRDRVGGYTDLLRDQHGVAIVDSPEEAVKGADAVLLESVDGRVHREQFERIAAGGKPVFIDKPFALRSEDAEHMAALASREGTPLMSCSALRFSEGFQRVLQDWSPGTVIGADLYGPMAFEPTQPGYFWYGIHLAEMLVAALGPGCAEVRVSHSDDHDLLVGTWNDGRIGTLRGNRKGNDQFGGMLHRERGSAFIDLLAPQKPYYASLLGAILPFFRGGEPPVSLEETLEVVRLLERGNAARASSGEARP